MDAATSQLVRQRAGNRCEYCRLPQSSSNLRFHVEHIVARQHRGSDDPDNLALACPECNLHKGTNLALSMQATPAPTALAPSTHSQWRIDLYPEIAAQLAGYVDSPFRQFGTLVLIDIGAGTLDTSTIVLEEENENDVIKPVLT